MKKRKLRTNSSVLKASLLRRDFWTGILTILVLVFMAIKLYPGQVQIKPYTAKNTSSTPAAKLCDNDNVVNTTPTPTPTVSNMYTVKDGDNYYKIAVSVCNNGHIFEAIQADNNGQPLHTGDQIVVNCTQ